MVEVERGRRPLPCPQSTFQVRKACGRLSIGALSAPLVYAPWDGGIDEPAIGERRVAVKVTGPFIIEVHYQLLVVLRVTSHDAVAALFVADPVANLKTIDGVVQVLRDDLDVACDPTVCERLVGVHVGVAVVEKDLQLLVGLGVTLHDAEAVLFVVYAVAKLEARDSVRLLFRSHGAWLLFLFVERLSPLECLRIEQRLLRGAELEDRQRLECFLRRVSDGRPLPMQLQSAGRNRELVVTMRVTAVILHRHGVVASTLNHDAATTDRVAHAVADKEPASQDTGVTSPKSPKFSLAVRWGRRGVNRAWQRFESARRGRERTAIAPMAAAGERLP